MKVLHVTPSIAATYGGPTQSLRGYLAASRQVGISASVAAPLPSIDDASQIAREVASGDMKLFHSIGTGGFVVAPTLVAWVVRHAKDFDVVHVHGLFNPVSSLSLRLAIGARVPTVVRPFGTMSKYTAMHRRSGLKSLYMSLIERGNLDRVAGFHFTTQAELDEAQWHGVAIGARGHIVPPPFLGDLRPEGRNHSTPTVLFIGRLHPIKHLEALVAAWPAVLASVPNARLIIAGEGDQNYVNSLRASAKTAQPGSISFEGFASEATKRDLWSRATILALVSHHENFGMVALEAAANGVASILSLGVQQGAALEAEGVARVVSVEPAVLAKAIVDGLLDREFQKRALSAGPDLARTTFSPTAIGRRLAEMYDAVVRAGNVSPVGRTAPA